MDLSILGSEGKVSNEDLKHNEQKRADTRSAAKPDHQSTCFACHPTTPHNPLDVPPVSVLLLSTVTHLGSDFLDLRRGDGGLLLRHFSKELVGGFEVTGEELEGMGTGLGWMP